MRDRDSTCPFVFFFLVLPYGISSGFVSITLPFVLTRVGFSVALAASIVAIGVSSNLWRFLWGPVADLTLTARRWYLLGLGTSAALLPPNTRRFGLDAAFRSVDCNHLHRTRTRCSSLDQSAKASERLISFFLD